MRFVVAVTGAIGAGKTTLALLLAADCDALHLSSDAIRIALPRNQARRGERVFGELHRAFERATRDGRCVVLDSTGMSGRFRALLRAHRAELVHVHLQLADVARFEQRERGRTDRPDGPLPRAAFLRSRRVQFHDAPDLVLLTDERTPDEVYREVRGFLGAHGYG